MTIALAIMSVMIIALSMYGVLLPHRLTRLVRDFMQRGIGGLWFAVAIRLLLGALLWLTAPGSHTPGLFKALSVLMFLTAVTLPMVGHARLNKFIAHIDSCPPWVIRLTCCLGVALGVFLLWSISSPPTAF